MNKETKIRPSPAAITLTERAEFIREAVLAGWAAVAVPVPVLALVQVPGRVGVVVRLAWADDIVRRDR